MPQKILVIGGHGKIALLLHPLLVGRGDDVDAVIRDPAQADAVRETGANPVVADVETMSVEELTLLMEGHDAVVWTAGAGGGNPARTYAVDRDAAIRSIDAADAAGVERYVMVSYHRSRPDHGVDPSHSFFPYAEAKAAADRHLRASSLDWTILGPSLLTLKPGTGRIALGGESGEVPRADVAAVAAECLRQPTTIGHTIRFNSGTIPISDALT